MILNVTWKGKRIQLKFNSEEKVVELEKPVQKVRQIPLQDIIAVKDLSVKKKSPYYQFCLHWADRRKPPKWKHKKLIFRCQNDSDMLSWQKTLTDAINELDRPKSLRVFVNPFGGKRKGLDIYTKSKKLYDIAGIEPVVTVTERAGHCQECLEEDVDKFFDGCVLYGGDGLFHEAVQVIMKRPREQRPKIGLVSAGSTNAGAATCYGVDDVWTMVLKIILGYQVSIDVAKAQFGSTTYMTDDDAETLYIINQIGYGFFAETVARSEALRCCGPARYDFGGAIALLRSHGYRARVTMYGSDLQLARSEESLHLLGNNLEGDHQVQEIEDDFHVLGIAVMPLLTKQAPQGLVPDQRIDCGTISVFGLKKRSRRTMLRFLMRTAGKDDQFSLEGAFQMKCSKVKIEAINENTWNCDGELKHAAVMSCEVLPGALTIMGTPEP